MKFLLTFNYFTIFQRCVYDHKSLELLLFSFLHSNHEYFQSEKKNTIIMREFANLLNTLEK